MKQHSKFTQWIVFSLLGIWGFVSFIFLAGEEDPMNPLSFEKFFFIKGAAGLSLYLCVRLGSWLNSKGLIPEMSEEDDTLFK